MARDFDPDEFLRSRGVTPKGEKPKPSAQKEHAKEEERRPDPPEEPPDPKRKTRRK
jgi:hypothetical protein